MQAFVYWVFVKSSEWNLTRMSLQAIQYLAIQYRAESSFATYRETGGFTDGHFTPAQAPAGAQPVLIYRDAVQQRHQHGQQKATLMSNDSHHHFPRSTALLRHFHTTIPRQSMRTKKYPVTARRVASSGRPTAKGLPRESIQWGSTVYQSFQLICGIAKWWGVPFCPVTKTPSLYAR